MDWAYRVVTEGPALICQFCKSGPGTVLDGLLAAFQSLRDLLEALRTLRFCSASHQIEFEHRS